MLRPPVDRRRFLKSTLAAASAGSLLPAIAAVAATTTPRPTYCAFIKFIQDYSYDELAERIADAGFDGIEATIRQKGYIEPERAVDELPKLVEALKRHDVEITIMTTDVVRVDDPLTEPLLRTAAKLGIARYRMGNYRYDPHQPVLTQLDALRPVIQDLAALNRQLGIQGLYQNHSGAQTVGAPVWDLHRLIQDVPLAELGIAFDIRHATTEGGLAWPLHYNLMRPHIGAIYIKDFLWEEGPNPRNVPLGKGRVDPRFFQMLKTAGYAGPISLHVEYLHDGSTEENYQALITDFRQLKQWLI